jgi:hypothetical protein
MNFNLPDVALSPLTSLPSTKGIGTNTTIPAAKEADSEPSATFIPNTEQISGIKSPNQVWLADSSVSQNNSEFSLSQILRDLGLETSTKFASFEELSAFEIRPGQKLENEIQEKIRKYTFSPIAELLGNNKDLNNLSAADNELLKTKLKNLTQEEEKNLVESVFSKANQVSDQIVKTISANSDGDDPQKYLRAKVLNNLTIDLKYVTNEIFESLPSFQGENDNEKILSDKFRLVYNLSNDDFIHQQIEYKKNFTKQDDYFSAPRANQVNNYNAFVNIVGQKDVPEYVQESLKKLFPTVDSKNFEKINIVDDPSMSFRGANIPTDTGNTIAVINPKNITAVAQREGITDLTQIQASEDSTIANELVHSAMKELFKDSDSEKLFFKNYSDSSYQDMNDLQFRELISNIGSTAINPSEAIVESLKTNEPRYEYSKLTTQKYLQARGFDQTEIKDIESASPEKRQGILESLVKKKNIDIDQLNTDFRDYLVSLGQDLIGHAQKQEQGQKK